MLFLIVLNFLIRSGWIKVPEWVLQLKSKVKPVKSGQSAVLIICFTCLGFLSLGFINKSNDSLPVPKGISNQLFYLQRDPDANTVIYQLNLIDGKPDDHHPVSAFWIRYAEEGQKKELSSIQKKLAYGLQSRKVDDVKHELNFVAYPELKFYLMKSAHDKKYHVYTQVKNQQIVLDRIFIRTSKKGLGWPSVVYIELNGKASGNGKDLTHRIYI